MKRKHISLQEIADFNNLLLALHKAIKGKRHRDDIRLFLADLDQNLSTLSQDILQEKLPYGRFKSFQIFDPKKRVIHAACFEDRVFHHAVMNIAGSKIERSMIYHSYACRKNKGVHKAIKQVQKNLQRYQWFVKIDINAYFSQVDHACLLKLLSRCYKGEAFYKQLIRIINSCPEMVEKGLPIGSLTSQYFANYYLDGLDRLLLKNKEVNANIRYMDDVIWWCDNKSDAKKLLKKVVQYLKDERGLTPKSNIQILPSYEGVTYCGFRITKAVVRLSKRRKNSIKSKRQYWEKQFLFNKITPIQLQMAYASIHAIAQGTDSLSWRQKQLRDNPPINC